TLRPGPRRAEAIRRGRARPRAGLGRVGGRATARCLDSGRVELDAAAATASRRAQRSRRASAEAAERHPIAPRHRDAETDGPGARLARSLDRLVRPARAVA